MKNAKYIMSCGCELKFEETVKILKYNNKNTCPDHPGSDVVKREIICECGQKMIVKPTGKVSEYCKICRDLRLKAAQKRSNDKKRKGNKQKKSVSVTELLDVAYNRNDCIHRNDCLTESFINMPRAKFLPCYGCNKYIPIDKKDLINNTCLTLGSALDINILQEFIR